MTVSYRPRHILALRHVKGTVLPEVWRMCFFTCALAYCLCCVYNPIRQTVRDGGKKTLLYYTFQDADAFFSMCTSFVTFILSFFNATVFGRWWRLRELCGTVSGRSVDTTVLLSAYVKNEEQLNEMLRYLWLAHALHVRSVDPNGQDGLLDQLVADGLLKPGEEHEALQRCTSLASSTPLSIAYGWFTSAFSEALRDVPPSLHAGLFSAVQANISAMRGAAADVLMYLSTPVPLAYTHLLEIMVVIYVLMAPVGLVPRLLWMAVPGSFVTTLIFYGFMCVGKLMLNPFDVHDPSAFDTAAFLEGTRFACLEVSAAVFRGSAAAAAAAGPTPNGVDAATPAQGGGKDSNGHSLIKDDSSGLRRRRGVSPGSSPLVTGSRPNGEVPGLDESGKQHRSRSVSPFSGLGS
tara:strand:- start:716 stop:1933 length:1218 start_codon:yes stop_codon:yes gene_type:complete